MKKIFLSSYNFMLVLLLVLLPVTFQVVNATTYFKESFDDPLEQRWVQSHAKSDYGKVAISHGAAYGDVKINKGLQTLDDAHFYAISSKLKEPFHNREKKLVISFSVKHEQGIDCGGGYIKLLPEMKLEEFNGESEYSIMFGPDICGHMRRIHLIFHYKGTNYLWKKLPSCPNDRLTHVYTLIVNPENSYEVQVDTKVVESGLLDEDWDFLKPKKIPDPNDKKPDDWIDEPMIPDPTDIKPDDWDNEAPTIPDPAAVKPDDWDENDDGVWEPPHKPNPKYKGPWTPKKISNPKYLGPWIPRYIENPEFVADPDLYVTHKPIAAVGFDVWQVRSGTIIDNIIISDSVEETNAFIEETWGATHEKEKEMLESLDKESSAKEPQKPDDYETTKLMYEASAGDQEDL